MDITREPITETPDNVSGAALILVDVVNNLVSDEGDALAEAAKRIVPTLVRLRDAATAAGLPVIYANDNFGLWRGGLDEILAHCSAQDSPGKAMASALAPRPCDYFVVKPQFSGFYATNLPVLLPRLGVTRLILGGVSADICVLFTAADAHMREYDLWVPADAVASGDDKRREWALGIMRQSMAAETAATDVLALEAWLRG